MGTTSPEAVAPFTGWPMRNPAQFESVVIMAGLVGAWCAMHAPAQAADTPPTAAPTTAPAPAPATPAPEQRMPSPDEVDAMVERLITAEGTESDLRWLYSDHIYMPSELGGTPIPAPALPRQGEGARRVWNPRWARFGVGNYVLTGGAAAVAMGSALLPTAPGRWSRRNRFDEEVRDAIGIEPYRDTTWARDTSDVLLSVAIGFPFLIDSLVVTYWYRNSHDVALQMALINAEAIAVAMALQGLTAGLASRERPYVRDCGKTISAELSDCDGRKPYRSFFSGHTTMSFASAAVTCSNHARHQVFGNSFADGLTCALAMGNAATVGVMRIVGDQHYATDVLVGAAVGTATGLGIPWLLHYGPLAPVSEPGDKASSLRWSVMPVANGLGIGGSF